MVALIRSWTVEPAKADRTIEIICAVCVVITALYAFGGGAG